MSKGLQGVAKFPVKSLRHAELSDSGGWSGEESTVHHVTHFSQPPEDALQKCCDMVNSEHRETFFEQAADTELFQKGDRMVGTGTSKLTPEASRRLWECHRLLLQLAEQVGEDDPNER